MPLLNVSLGLVQFDRHQKPLGVGEENLQLLQRTVRFLSDFNIV